MGTIMMAKKKEKKRVSVINLGTIVFLVIIIYLTAYVIQYLGKEKLTRSVKVIFQKISVEQA